MNLPIFIILSFFFSKDLGFEATTLGIIVLTILFYFALKVFKPIELPPRSYNNSPDQFQHVIIIIKGSKGEFHDEYHSIIIQIARVPKIIIFFNIQFGK